MPIEVRPLDDYGLNPTLVKLDVEFYEAQVLTGMQDTIARCRPLVMLESRDPEVREFFARRSYRYAERSDKHLTLTENINFSVNGFFLPEERLSEYRQRGALR
jgi:hypothetical protein